MASVMQGDAYNIPVTIKSGNGTLITPEIAACAEITVGQFTKRWPGQVTFDEKTGEWQFPVTQKQTFRFAPGAAVVQARVVFQDGSIMGGSGAPVRVEQSASRGTLPQPEKVEAATGSAPKATEVTIPTVHDIDVSLHSQVILSDPIKAPYIGDNGNWYEYDAATGTFVDTGTAASGTPPITPDTAGKYLTNDGSKAEWAKIEALPEGGVEGQVLTKKSDADGDAEWKNAVQSDWCEIDESSPSYIKNKLGGYYEADLDTLLGYGSHQQTDGSWEYVLFPDFKKVEALDILYIQATFLKSEEAIATFATFNELTDKNNGIGFYLGNKYSGPLGIEYSIYGASLTHINIYSAGIIPMRREFIPLAKDNAIGGVKLHQTVDNVDYNFWDAVAIDQDGDLFSKKSIQVIESLTSDNVKSLFASAGEAFIVGGSPYLEEKIGLISSDFPIFVTATEVDYSSGYPRFVYLFFTKTNKSGEFILTTGGDVSSYSIAISESNLFLVHLIQGELGSDGKPTYTVDKTFAEIKTACDAGKKVELIPPADDRNFIVSVGSVPLEVINVTIKTINFLSLGASSVGISDSPTWMLGGVPFGAISVSISSDEKVSVEFPFHVDGDTVLPVWDMIQKLPQQYVVAVTAGADGNLSANNTLDQLQSVAQAYSYAVVMNGSASINATYNGKLYYMSAATRTSVTFAATTENGLETLTVSNDGKEGSTDVWTHEIAPLGIPPVSVTTADNGKFLRVVNGQWEAEAVANAKGVSF